MSVRINIDQSQINNKVNNPLSPAAMAALCSVILRDCNEFCKMDTKALINSSLIHSDLEHGVLKWVTPYAARQYYEIQTAYTAGGNPKATWRWVEVAKSRYHERWGLQAQQFMRLYG